MRKRRRKKRISITLLVAMFIFMGIGYAFINSTLRIEGATTISKNSWDVRFENLNTINGTFTEDETISIGADKTSINFNITLETIDDYYQVDVDIKNAGGIDAMLKSIETTGLSDNQKEYLEFYATYNNGAELTINDKLPTNEYDTISIFIKYKDEIDEKTVLSKADDYLTLNMTLTYGQATDAAINRGSNLINVMSKNAQSDETIKYNEVSSETNGQGIYYMQNTKSDSNPIYFYRGNIQNNNVKFADSCWLIVRTTNTGGIKLIYNGTPTSSGACNATGADTMIGTSAYNQTANDNAYAGYMYGNSGSSTYEETHSNINDSEIKKTIDTWYSQHLIDSTSKLEDTVWCNNRAVSSATTGIGKVNGNYKGKLNFQSENSPELYCENENDKFTVSEKNGNGALTYPIATITAAELKLAGISYATSSSNFYLANNKFYWTMTPCMFNNNLISIIDMHDNNISTEYHASHEEGVRPMISLKRGTRYTSGDGTKNYPYIVS